MSKLNLQYYDGNSLFVYPFLKNIEPEILEEIKSTKDFEFLKGKISLDTLHFTGPERVFSVSSLDFDKDDEVLEINAGFGVVTQYLCDRVKHVSAVEFAKQNVDVLYERLRDRDNLEIYLGNISQMQFERKFDYIILTDVLEMASFFFKSINPYREFISFCKKLLKPDGTLVLQAFNRFGIKNWLGEADEHTVKAFDGLMDYPKFSLHSFGKIELEKLFNEIGFKNIQFYYPLPNHFFPNQVLSQDYLSKSDVDTKIFKHEKYSFEKDLIEDIKRLNELEFFASSFMICANNGEIKQKLEHSYFYSEMFINTKVFIDDNNNKKAKKIPLNDIGIKFLNNMYTKYKKESERLIQENINDISLVKCQQDGNFLLFDWAKGKSLENIAKEETLKGEDAHLEFLKKYKEFVYKLYPKSQIMDFETDSIIDGVENTVLKNVACVKMGNCDLNFSNIFYDDETKKYCIIDYDRLFSGFLPINFLLMIGVCSEDYYSYTSSEEDINHPWNIKIREVLEIEKQEFDTYLKIIPLLKTNAKGNMFDIFVLK